MLCRIPAFNELLGAFFLKSENMIFNGEHKNIHYLCEDGMEKTIPWDHSKSRDGKRIPSEMDISISNSWGAKIRNRYNQVPHLTQDTNGKVTNSQLDTSNESQEVSPFPAGDHKAHINRHEVLYSPH